MNYEWNEEQRMLKEAARSFLVKECPSSFVREMSEDKMGYSTALWGKMAALGWMGLMFPEKYGGYGANFLDLTVLLYEMGYVCLPGPFLATVILGGLTVLDVGSDLQKGEILPKIASGDKLMTLAWCENEGTYPLNRLSTKAILKNNEYKLTGTKFFVPDAHVASTFICVAETEETKGAGENGPSLFLVDQATPGVKLHELLTISGEKQYAIEFDQANIPKENIVGQQGMGGMVLKKIFNLAAVAKCAEMCGSAEKVLEMLLLHVNERVQFGHKISHFQAVQHHCADILTFLQTSKFMTCRASWKISIGDEFAKEAAICKAWVSESHRRLVALAHQVMGGIGFMEEHDLNLHFKRAKTAELSFGSADFHREKLAQYLGF